MKIYFYCEKNKCKNSGKPVLLGDSTEYLRLLEDGATALASTDVKENDFLNTAICLGEFDGIHQGHRALFDEAKTFGRWGVLLFDRNIKGNENLTTQSEKIRLIKDFGAEYVVITEFSERFSKRTPEEFADFLENTLKVEQIVCGYDYRFGYKAQGHANDLIKLCQNIEVKVLNPVEVNNEPIKSTTIRNLIKVGDIKTANLLLGYNYKVSGKVEQGFGNGRKMGIPTANISFSEEKLLPPDGVYFGFVLNKPSVINIGKNPTFDAQNRTVEVHITDFSGDLYNRNIEAEFIEKIRNDIKFNSVESLVSQIKKDIEYVKGKRNYGKENIN